MDRSQVIAILEESLNNVIQKTGRLIGNELEQKLNSRPKSEYYDRTGDVVHAFRNPPYIKIGADGNISGSIYGSEWIRQIRTARRKFNQHMGFNGELDYNGISIKEWMPTWLDEGYKVPRKGRIKGLNYLRSALDGQNLSDFINDRIVKEAGTKLSIMLSQIR